LLALAWEIGVTSPVMLVGQIGIIVRQTVNNRECSRSLILFFGYLKSYTNATLSTKEKFFFFTIKKFAVI